MGPVEQRRPVEGVGGIPGRVCTPSLWLDAPVVSRQEPWKGLCGNERTP